MGEPVTGEPVIPKYEEEGRDITRDRIVILGRQGAGKTVYLSLLYDLLWRSKGDLKIKAVHGEDHREFMKTALGVREGKWPGATASNRRAYIEISRRKENRLMVAMDYSGELIEKAFVAEEDTDEVRELLDHLDHAAAVMLFIDPAQVAGSKASIDSSVENDFGIVQGVARLRTWAGGVDVPIVLVLTKVDLTGPLLRQHGGTDGFVRKFFPKLIARTRNLRVCKISAVQTAKNGEGQIKRDFVPTNLEMPLLYCLDKISEVEKNVERAKIRQKNVQTMKLDRKRSKIIGGCIAAVLAIAVGVVICYIVAIMWPVVLDKWFVGS